MANVFLIPSFLFENAVQTIPAYVLGYVQQCQVFFVENERSARRFLKQLWPQMTIDNYQWFTIHKAENEVQKQFLQCLDAGNNIGIISEAGCPGVADPGQILVAAAQKRGATVKPLVGPSSILLALMASGMNGQKFQFNGYLPIQQPDRKQAIRELEAESSRKNSTQIFIETPFRNNQLIKELTDTCKPETQLCIAINITAPAESIQTKAVRQWKANLPDCHKQLVIYLLMAN